MRWTCALFLLMASAVLGAAGYRLQVSSDEKLLGYAYAVILDGEPFAVKDGKSGVATDAGLSLLTLGTSNPHIYVGASLQLGGTLAEGVPPRFLATRKAEEKLRWTIEFIDRVEASTRDPVKGTVYPYLAKSTVVLRLDSGPFQGKYFGIDPKPVMKEAGGKQIPLHRFQLVGKDEAARFQSWSERQFVPIHPWKK